jgi:hypothetical protein
VDQGEGSSSFLKKRTKKLLSMAGRVQQRASASHFTPGLRGEMRLCNAPDQHHA